MRAGNSVAAVDSSASFADLNEAGFRTFSAMSMKASDSGTDMTFSPIADWCLHEYLKSRKDGDAVRGLLRDQLAIDVETQNKQYFFSVRVHSHDILKHAGSDVMRASYYSAQDTHAVRLEFASDTRALYVFSGPVAQLEAMRHSLTADSWTALTQKFADTLIRTPSLVFSFRAAESAWPECKERFSAFSTVTLTDSELDLDATAVLDKPICGSLDIRFPTYKGSIDIAQPTFYVVQDQKTGVILLMGMHI